MATKVSQYILYKWRYPLGYGLFALLITGLLLLAWLGIPGGLTTAEINSAVRSSSIIDMLIAMDPSAVLNLPYRLMQYASIELLGVTPLSIKLPALVLGMLSTLGIVLLLRKWFAHNIAIIAAVLVIATGEFIFLAQNGTSETMYIFWPVWLLVSALMISRGARARPFWYTLLVVVAALSLYTPFGIYVLIALASACLLHPHLRYLLGKVGKARLITGGIASLILVAPLGYAIFLEPSIGLRLLGIPTTAPDLLANLTTLKDLYLGFMAPGREIIPTSATGFTVVMTPVYGLGTALLIILGLVRLFTTKHTARSYVVIAWLVLLVPLVVIQPQYHTITFVPIVLLVAMGMGLLLSRWYGLFPKNPYARVVGLVPLAILLGGMVFSGVDRYLYGYTYDPSVSALFSKDLKLLNAQLRDTERGTTTLVVTEPQQPFYQLIAKHSSNTSVALAGQPVAAQTTIMTKDAYQVQKQPDPWRIVVNGVKNDSDRFYIYKTPAN